MKDEVGRIRALDLMSAKKYDTDGGFFRGRSGNACLKQVVTGDVDDMVGLWAFSSKPVKKQAPCALLLSQDDAFNVGFDLMSRSGREFTIMVNPKQGPEVRNAVKVLKAGLERPTGSGEIYQAVKDAIKLIEGGQDDEGAN